jgi:membrane fusion protein (multidrug efflux system)
MKRAFVLVILVLVLGAGAAGLYYYQANSDTGEPANTTDESSDAGNEAESSSEEQAEGEASAEDDEEEDGEAAVPVNIIDASVGSVSTYITATANLVPENEVVVLAETEGRVTHLEVEEGDHVETGELLARLLQDDEEIALRKAEVRAANAKLAFERAERMNGESLIAQEEYDRITMDHRIAQQELAEAEWRVRKTEVRAPFDGRVTWRNVTLGQHIRPGDELFRVTDFDPLVSRIYLPETDVLALNAGREVDITLKANEEVQFQGRIQRISPIVDVATGTVKVTIEAIEPPAVVRPGGFVIVDIVRETHEAALVLPRKAVVRELKNSHVFVVKDDVAEKRVVEVGLDEDEQLEIVAGLEAGEQVVVAGQGGLKDGSKIKVLEPDESTQASNRDDSRRPARG